MEVIRNLASIQFLYILLNLMIYGLQTISIYTFSQINNHQVFLTKKEIKCNFQP